MYIVIEIQKSDTVSTITNAPMEYNHANQKYHEVLSYAAVSNIPQHSVTMLADDGNIVKHETIFHEAADE